MDGRHGGHGEGGDAIECLLAPAGHAGPFLRIREAFYEGDIGARDEVPLLGRKENHSPDVGSHLLDVIQDLAEFLDGREV